MVAVLDYGVGNLRSVRRGLEAAGAEVEVTADTRTIDAAAGVVLPGVGAFAPARQKLADSNLDRYLVEIARLGKPVLGVCLGYQLLFAGSYEDGYTDGLGLLPGPVRRLVGTGDRKVPHMGWNRVKQVRPDILFEGIPDRSYFYFVHSYYPELKGGPEVAGTCDYGRTLTVVARSGSVAGTQFHPEKSGPTGLRLYANFVVSCGGAPRAVAPAA
ncbi:MAG TPA: imidazole glycerol phosphate synthase subunit HisH, partial [Candidatus Dormibacteraeota bacterium]|nr:imidazole glycerol phosphate synthase subunit HisH [Candidatus Dormibacteraeota bacterium]